MTKHILLTGATGLVGCYLLRDLVLEGAPLAVLIRSQKEQSARRRLEHILVHWERVLGRPLSRPVCLEGDITLPGLGLSPSSARFVAQHCDTVLHNAASLRFIGPNRALDPWLSNLTGTAHVVEFCRTAKLRRLHYVSTAYVCGQRNNTVYEGELDEGQAFRNDYEHSKLEAEKLVRAADHLDSVTVYRPSIILGDWRSGYTTSYHALYSYFYFVWLYTKDAEREPDGRIHAPLRMNLARDTRRNMVPVDWVAAATSFLVLHEEHHGLTYHLTPPDPITAGQLEEAMASYFKYYGPQFVGDGGLVAADMNDFEKIFYAYVEQYQPYWSKEPTFDCTNTLAAMPSMPCPQLDGPYLHRLLDFAIQDQWGRRRKQSKKRQLADGTRSVPAASGVEAK